MGLEVFKKLGFGRRIRRKAGTRRPMATRNPLPVDEPGQPYVPPAADPLPLQPDMASEPDENKPDAAQ